MADEGLSDRAPFGDLRDLISRHASEGAVVSLEPDDPLTIAYARMRLYDVSQLPVLSGGKLVGIVDESDLLLAAHRTPDSFDRPVRDVMTSKVQTISHKAPIDELFPIFDAGLVAVVNDEQGFHGLITRIDVLNHLRKRRALLRSAH
jgi:cystathionine beta-synthase